MNRKIAALLIAAALTLAALTALAAPAAIDLFNGYRSNKAKIEAFTEWFYAQNFSKSEYNAWADAFSRLTGVSANTVFVASKGTKYHANLNCTALSNSYEVMTLTLQEALDLGFTPCSRCVK